MKKIVKGDDRCGAARVAGVTLRGAGLGGAFRGISAVEPSLSGLASELSESARGWDVVAEDGPTGPTLVGESSGSALRDCADGLSERDPVVSDASGFSAGGRKVFAAGGVEVCEAVWSGNAGR